MIARLRGNVLEKGPEDAVVDVNGVGYRVNLSTVSLGKLPADGQPVDLRIRTVVREDAFELFGFLSPAEEELFQLLNTVSRVGPRMALGVMSGMEVGELIAALSRGETARLAKIHGVGKKTAERLVLELKEKVRNLHSEGIARGTTPKAPVTSSNKADLVSALLNLGYKQPQAEKAADVVIERLGPDTNFQALFREALKSLRSTP
ncbi:Holliday junction branch migration protein RuvA [Corallococcus sp. AB049A]|uniref:Holliday junction branch migration protein RuvA n=1 Tax=Corallococcus sp. AB049A TaxID=2316721 RepID=UPI000EA19F06|nr:Holliday junction branch migration protein RuvA [Corallococcus sp. AB049A]RKH51272.1 Holliday junction branch migration protein RuvA [Corallococcus sp. AB050B]RKI63408.1 Holliday junction branch migration protein RuvA [Corallococcus sp. AB049A]